MRYFMAMAFVAAMCGSANAELSVVVEQADNSAAPELIGYVTQDIVIDTTTDWLSAQLIVTLDTPGQIYQHPLQYGDGSPSPALISTDISAAFDTYVSNGVLGTNIVTMSPVGLGGTVKVFDQDHISVSWFTMSSDETGNRPLARISLAESANGTWIFRSTASPAGGPVVEMSGKVVSGVMCVAGDLDASYWVGQMDLDIVLDSWQHTVPYGDRADPTNDGVVNQDDLDVVTRYWGFPRVPIRYEEP